MGSAALNTQIGKAGFVRYPSIKPENFSQTV
jgi:hypothetical protein